MRRFTFFIVMMLYQLKPVCAQQKDTVVVNNKVITLSEIIIRNNVNVPSFIERVKNDTTFYKAFRNLRVLQFTSLNDIRMLDKKGKVKASLFSRTRQWAQKGCRHTLVEDEQVEGDIYDRRGNYNYYTPELYAGLFFASDTVCGETNVVKGMDIDVKGKSGMAKRKEQLKMLFFNPGKSIPTALVEIKQLFLMKTWRGSIIMILIRMYTSMSYVTCSRSPQSQRRRG